MLVNATKVREEMVRLVVANRTLLPVLIDLELESDKGCPRETGCCYSCAFTNTRSGCIKGL